MTRWQIPTRALALTVAVLALLLLVALLIEARSAGVRDLPPATAGSPAEPLGNGQFRFFPKSTHVSLGVRYRFLLYTHCGLDNPVAVDFDGSFWDRSEPGPAAGGSGNPPTVMGDPFDKGVMTLISPLNARYLGTGGSVVSYRRHPGPRVAGLCF